MNLLLFYTLIWLILFAVRRVSFFRFDVVFTLMLFLSALLAGLPLVDFPQPARLDTQLLVILVHLPLCIGFNLAPHTANDQPLVSPDERFEVPKVGGVETVLTAFALLFVVMSAVWWGLTLRIPVFSNLADLEAIRSSHQYTQASDNLLQRGLALLGHFGFAYAVLSPLYVRGSTPKTLLAIVCALALVDLSLATGARAAILFLGLSTAVTYCCLKRLPPAAWFLGFVLLALSYYVLGGLFYLARNPAFADSSALFLAHNCSGARYAPPLDDASAVVKAMVLSSCYFSTPILSLQTFIDTVGNTWTPQAGSYLLSIIFREEFVQTRQELAAIYAGFGIATNPWATFARDLYIDFGYFMSLPAFVIGWALRFMVLRGPYTSDVTLLRFAILSSMGFIAAFMSPFVIRPLIYPLLLMLVLPIVLPLITSRLKSRSEDRSPLATPQ